MYVYCNVHIFYLQSKDVRSKMADGVIYYVLIDRWGSEYDLNMKKVSLTFWRFLQRKIWHESYSQTNVSDFWGRVFLSFEYFVTYFSKSYTTNSSILKGRPMFVFCIGIMGWDV